MQARSRFLKRLLCLSGNGFAAAPVRLEAPTLLDAYFAFTALTGVLGVPIDQAAQLLEREVR